MQSNNPHGRDRQGRPSSASRTTEPPVNAISIDRIAAAIAANLRWYAFRWNGKGLPPAFFHFPAADEVTLEAGEPAAIIPAPDNGSPLDVVRAAYLDGAKLDGIAWLAPGTKRPELFRVNGDCLIWTQQTTATQAEKVGLLDALGLYDVETRAILIDSGMLPKPSAATEPTHQAANRQEAPKPKIEIINAVEFAKIEFPPIRWAVDGILPSGSTVFAGPPKMGKTRFMFNMGSSQNLFQNAP